MTHCRLFAAFLLGILCSGADAADAYRTPEASLEALRALASGSGGLLTLETIARTREGREVTAATLALPGGAPLFQRQALLVVAGLDGRLLHTTEAVLGVLQDLLRRKDEPDVRAVLAGSTLYFVPQANPDVAARCFAKPLRESPLNAWPRDDDRDSRIDEDGPEDLDGDGEILSMRVPDPDGPLVVDGADPRILRPLAPGEAASARFRLIEEGVDSDGDGQVNEDPPGGVNVAENFPHEFEPRGPGSGPYPASEPEARGLLDFLVSHPNIQAAVTYGPHDNLVSPPPPRDGPPERRGEHRLWRRDAELHAEVAARYREITGLKAKPMDESLRGTWHETVYFEHGIPSFATCLFGGEPPGAADGPIEKRWLQWNDVALEGKGFVPWKPFQHPQLGAVHIGGWRPLVRVNPPVQTVAAMAPAQAKFLLELAAKLARLQVDAVRVKELGGGLFEVRARVVNRGEFPTAFVQGVYTYRRSPINVELAGEGLRFIGGEARATIESLDGHGGSREVSWLILGTRGTPVAINVRLRGQPLASVKAELAAGGSL